MTLRTEPAHSRGVRRAMTPVGDDHHTVREVCCHLKSSPQRLDIAAERAQVQVVPVLKARDLWLARA